MDFRDRMHEFDSVLETLCENQIDYVLQGEVFFLSLKGNPLLVAAWSQDGIHPAKNTRYFAKFAYEVHAALIAALPFLGFSLLLLFHPLGLVKSPGVAHFPLLPCTLL